MKRRNEEIKMFLIAGLGNPSSRYEKTRHNIGFDVIDAVSDRYNIEVKEKKAKALCGSGFIEGQKVLLVKPQTYMNLSGDSISALMNFYKLDPARELIVIYDDISLDVGQLRIRKKGSAGGHNGIKNIIAHLGTQEFPRIKVGVGDKPPRMDLADYVLSRFSQGERRLVDEAAAESVEALALMVQGRIEEAMNLYNRKKTVKESNDGNSL